ncbi:MAG: gamma-glutamyltransferase [Alphaproteobacteria bacterium]|nr:gamma-glutamyltransferase [Alphaproteobacteria bacterium]MCZ6741827.1 gamma-glutamyltransferase [Alphaproteobacteria bacterium]
MLSNPAGDFVAGFRSAVAGDEPQSVLIAQQVLGAGGSAADAVVAGYFAMSVGLPSAASLGGGGVCMVSDARALSDKAKKTKKTIPPVETLIFTHGGRAKVAAPGNVRGMYALHARYGELSWARLLAPAESMARFGFTVSKAMALRLRASSKRIKAAPGLRLIFTDARGALVRAGGKLRQIDLAATLSRIRRVPGRFIRGAEAARLAAAYRQAGVPLTAAEVENQRPEWRPPISVRRRNRSAEFPPTPAGVVAAQMWAVLYRDGYWRDADDADKPHLVAEVTKRVFADSGVAFYRPSRVVRSAGSFVGAARMERLMASYRPEARTPWKDGADEGRAAPSGQGSAGIVAADRFGLAVACAFTMNRPMGAARLVPRTGIVMAAPPDHAGRGGAVLGLMLLRRESQNELEYLGVATGDAAAPVALVTTALGVMVDGSGLEAAQKQPRTFNGAVPDRVMVERGAAGEAVAKGLRAKGHVVQLVPPLGRLNAFICPRGFEGPSSRCEVRTDPRGLGFAEGK